MYKPSTFNNGIYTRGMGVPTGTGTVSHPRSHWGSIFTNVTFLAEIGAMLIVDALAAIPSGGSALPLIGATNAMILNTAIGVIGASTRLGISVGVEHQINAISTSIDFGSAFLPIPGEIFRSYKMYNTAVKNYEEIIQEGLRKRVKDIHADAISDLRNARDSRYYNELGNTISQNRKDLKYARNLWSDARRGLRKKSLRVNEIDDREMRRLNQRISKLTKKKRFFDSRERRIVKGLKHDFISKHDAENEVRYVKNQISAAKADRVAYKKVYNWEKFGKALWTRADERFGEQVDNLSNTLDDLLMSQRSNNMLLDYQTSQLDYLSSYDKFLAKEDVGEYAELQEFAKNPSFMKRKLFMSKYDIRDALDQHAFIQNEKLLTAEQKKRVLFTKLQKRRYENQQLARLTLDSIIKNLPKTSYIDSEAIYAIISKIQHVDGRLSAYRRDIKKLYETLQPETKKAFADSIQNFSRTIQGYVGTGNSDLHRAIRFIGSRHIEAHQLGKEVHAPTRPGFYNRYVRRIRLLDMRDNARQLPEFIYRKSISAWRKFMRKIWQKGEERDATAAKQVTRGVSKKLTLTEARKSALTRVKKAFVEGGGILVPENDYLLGFKVLSEVPDREGKHSVLLMFDPMHTAAENEVYRGRETKNFGGKKAVLTQATDKDIEQLTINGVNYYWLVGEEKGWYINKGGNSIGMRSTELTGEMSLFLGFIPIQTLRNILGISTVVVNNTGRAVYYRGNYIQQWKKTWTRIFEKTSINRTARFLTRYVAGDLAVTATRTSSSAVLKKVANRFGREFQRISNTTLNVFEKTSANGTLKFRFSGGQAIFRRYLAAGLNSTRVTEINAGKGINARARKKLPAGAHFRGRRYERIHRSNIRKFGQVRRVPGAFTPKNYVKTRTWGRYRI